MGTVGDVCRSSGLGGTSEGTAIATCLAPVDVRAGDTGLRILGGGERLVADLEGDVMLGVGGPLLA